MFLNMHAFVFTALPGGNIDMMETMPMVEDFGFLDMLLKPADQNTPEDRYGTVDGKNPAPIFLGIKKRFRASDFFPSTVLYL